MTYRKHGLGLVVVAALAVMAFASTAQALTPLFYKNGSPVAALQTLEGVIENSPSTLLVKALNFKLNCTGFTVSGGEVETNLKGKATLLYEGCTALNFTTGEELAACHVSFSAVLPNVLHVQATAVLLPAELLNGNPAILAEDISALIRFLSGVGCALPLDSTVTGDLCLAVTENHTKEVLVASDTTIQTECRPRETLKGPELASGGLKDKLLYGAQESFVDGKAFIFDPAKANTYGVLLD